MVNMVARYNRLPDMSRADVDLLAADIANFIRGELANINDHGFGELKTLYTWYIRAGFISSNSTLSHHIGSGLKKNMSVRMKSHRLSPKCLTMGGGAVVCAV